MSQANQILFLSTFSCAFLCLLIQNLIDFPLPFLFLIFWVILITSSSAWMSCIILKFPLKANTSITSQYIPRWLQKKLKIYFNLYLLQNESSHDKTKMGVESQDEESNDPSERMRVFEKIISKIDSEYVQVWVKNISDDEEFLSGIKDLLLKLSILLKTHISEVNMISLGNKVADILLLHLKEYKRALFRVKKGHAANVEEAYNYFHPGSRSANALEYSLSRIVTIMMRELLQWEINNSLPCKLISFILAKKLLRVFETISSPLWILKHLTKIDCTPVGVQNTVSNGITSALVGPIITGTAAALLARPLTSGLNFTTLAKNCEADTDYEKCSLSSEISINGYRCLWSDTERSGVDSEFEENEISPVYEEPTDLASTIARLRDLLQEKSNTAIPLLAEEKSCINCEESQFTNLVIPWTEFYTAPDGSQQLLYCIQYDDIEQHEALEFRASTATVRRQYSDFVQLHNSLEKIPLLAGIMVELTLPEGGRIEMENYLKILCSRVGNEVPIQLRRFLRPHTGVERKADIVAPRLDKFLVKTVSGVFNTLKTVVPGFEMEQGEEGSSLPTLMPLADIPWRFVQNNESRDLALDLSRLVADRTDYYLVDTAYEAVAVDCIESSGNCELMAHWWKISDTACDEDINELDTNLSLACAAIDLTCEILAGINSSNTFQQEAVVKWFKLILGDVIEIFMQNIISWLHKQFQVSLITPSVYMNENDNSIEFLCEESLKSLQKSCPNFIKLILGENDTKEMLKFMIASIGVEKINKDLLLQIFDVVVSQILASCRLYSQKNIH